MPLAGVDIAAVEVLGLALHEGQAQDQEVAGVQGHYCDEEDQNLKEIPPWTAILL